MDADKPMNTKIKEQFNLRAKEFELSANWVLDSNLIQAHVDLAGNANGRALDLCCGTGRIGRVLKEKGWDVQGLDIAENMLKISSSFFPVFKGSVEDMPFRAKSFQLVVCRQSFQFLEVREVLPEIARVLAAEGIFILSLTMPFSEEDKEWLSKIHRVKQPLLRKFYTARDLAEELRQAGFSIKENIILSIRESINKWMNYAPELAAELRDKVISLVKNAPRDYKRLHRVKVIDGEVFEDWNWVVFKAQFSKQPGLGA